MKHIQAGEYPQAIAVFRDAEARFHAPTILLELARAHAHLGQLLEARTVYRKIVAEQLANYAPPVFFEAQRTAVAELPALEMRIPIVELIVIADRPRQDIELTHNGKVVPPGAEARIECDLDRQIFTARVPGRPEVTREVTLTEGASQRVVFELRAPPTQPRQPPPTAAPPPKSPPPLIGAEQPTGFLVPALIGFGVGAAGLGVGAVTGILAVSKTAALDDRCPDRICVPTEEGDHATARHLATASTVGFIVGGVGVAAGVTLLLLHPGSGSRAPERSGLIVGPAWIGWKGGF